MIFAYSLPTMLSRLMRRLVTIPPSPLSISDETQSYPAALPIFTFQLIRNDLWRTLSMHGVSSGLIQALKSLHTNSSALISINEAYIDWFDIRRGVREGYVGSLWLFNLFMDSCLNDLNESRLRMTELSLKCLLYAD
ncbi:hypothetical protein EVAR_38294_1 [Eumeta japonica]|uniref:Uncharacterized protein n=1 Tax=Eumeta variegata TaxID=151549 RepID=A0A4C1W9J5_EUMVA|nr:hypothetical protein EVAR_38294_1 [Eumeta japonica]